MRNRQVGPDESTEILRDLVQRLTYKPKWRFELAELDREQGSQGLTLCISADGIPNSLDEYGYTTTYISDTYPDYVVGWRA